MIKNKKAWMKQLVESSLKFKFFPQISNIINCNY